MDRWMDGLVICMKQTLLDARQSASKPKLPIFKGILQFKQARPHDVFVFTRVKVIYSHCKLLLFKVQLVAHLDFNPWHDAMAAFRASYYRSRSAIRQDVLLLLLDDHEAT